MVDKQIHRRKLNTGSYPQKRSISEPEPSQMPHTHLNGEELEREVRRRLKLNHPFQKIASELGITYVEVARIAGGLK